MIELFNKMPGRLFFIKKYLLIVSLFTIASISCLFPNKAEARFGLSTYDATSITLMAADALNLDGQSGWTFYNGVDAPEGGFLASNSNNTQTFTLTLPTNLLSGTTYYIFFYGIGYDYSNTVSCTAGGSTSSTVTFDDRDVTRYWTPHASITPGSSSNTLVCTINKQNGVLKYLIRGIYITTDANITVTSQGVAVNLNIPAGTDDTAIKGNLISNGNFEAGIDGTWGIGITQNTNQTTLWDNKVGHSGGSSLAIPIDANSFFTGQVAALSLTSRVYHLKDNRKYTFSVWMKTSTNTTGCSVSVVNAYEPPSGYDPQYYISSASGQNATSYTSDFTCTTSWKRFYVTGYLKKYPQMDYVLSINANGLDVNGAKLYVSDVQLEEGDLTDFAPASPLESIVTTGKSGNVFYSSDSLVGTVRSHNNTSSSITKTLQYQIYDSDNILVTSGSQDITVSAGQTSTRIFHFLQVAKPVSLD